ALHALDRSGRGGAAPDDGLFTGAVGVAVAAEHVAGLLGRADVRDRARALVLGRLDAGASAPGEAGGGFDLVSGAAGTVVGLLLLHRAWGERALLDAATRLGDALLEAGSTSPAGLSWASPGIASSAHLTGLSHGASGPAWALAELAAATGLPGPRGAALDAVRYETACRDPVTGAWPDFRTGRPSGRRDGPPPTLWCHGAAGIGLARARITSLLHDETCAREAEEATALVRAEVRRGLARPDAGWSLCHGLAGTADALLTASTGSASVGSASVRFASVGSASAAPATSVGDAELLAAVGRAGRDRAAAWTAPDHPVGLMTGAAGVGLLHLRLARPSTASVLLLTSA
ncbi:hypothetical protein ICW40_12575, partial [Actinotalea ferrariae]|uniref:lanthionine synthetase LanC family protein n=1 Tax=Actinotalea ferrariae TaxID=1386098 RepID=UPI001C8CBE30